MLTGSAERFEAIAAEAPDPAARALLSRATSHAEGADCATWVVAKQCGAADQAWAPPGTHFHQVPSPLPAPSCGPARPRDHSQLPPPL